LLKSLRQRMQDDKGFTLIELMVVVLIIAILIAIAIPTFLGLRQRAQDRAAQSNLRNGLTASKAFYTDDETFVGFFAEAGNIEPSLTWNNAAAAVEGEVTVRTATDDQVVLTTVSESGQAFCIADDVTAGGARRGDEDTNAYANCGPTDW
jgi:type IV pilus assembly protein PilA